MNEQDKIVMALSDKMTAYFYDGSRSRAKEIASELEKALGEPNPRSLERYNAIWADIAEVRGDIHEAIRIADMDIVRTRTHIEMGGYENYPGLLTEDVQHLQDGLYFQAMRYEKTDEMEKAKGCLREIYSLGEQFGVEPDEDVQALFDSLATSSP